MNTKAGHPALFEFPQRTALNRPVPKSRIVAAGKPGRRVRDALTAQVAQIIWQYKLAPETLNLSASRSVPEIQVFTLALKPGVNEELPEDIMRTIDKAIGFPILFELREPAGENDRLGRLRVAAAYKRPSEAEAGKWVVGDYFASDWLPADTPRQPLPVALNMARLYEQLLSPLIATPARPGEELAERVQRQARMAVKQREYQRLEVRVQREKQFNRKVELNRQLRELRTELEALA
jgi:hypothetical protein